MNELKVQEVKNSRIFRERRTKPNSKKFFVTEFSAMCEVEMIDFVLF